MIQDVQRQVFAKGESVNATFIGANPRNNLRLEDTFAAVEYKKGPASPWERVRDDSDWSLIYRWKRKSSIWGTSEVTIDWTIDSSAPPGQYRLRYFGDAKSMGGTYSAFEGASSAFSVLG